MKLKKKGVTHPPTHPHTHTPTHTYTHTHIHTYTQPYVLVQDKNIFMPVDFRRIFTGALVGAVVGVAAQSVTLSVDPDYGSTNERKKLEPQPEAFDMDKESYRLFLEWANFKGNDRKTIDAYEQALSHVDQLLLLEQQLESEKIQATLYDLPLAQTHIREAQLHLSTLLHATSTTKDVKTKQKLFKETVTFLLHHLRNIQTRCSSAR